MNIINGIINDITIEKPSLKNKKVAVAVARFNSTITEKLCIGAIKCWKEYGGNDNDIDIIMVPGAFELPSVAKKLEAKKKYKAIVCLGAVIRGETGHYDVVAGNAASGIAHIGQEGNIPVIFGVLTVDTFEQAEDRAKKYKEDNGQTMRIREAFAQTENNTAEDKKKNTLAQTEDSKTNAGYDAMRSAIDMMSVYEQIDTIQ